MFTGIIEEVGLVKDIVPRENLISLKIGCKKVLEDLKIGDSIATNGVCLTARDFGEDFFLADLMKTSANTTSLGQLKLGDRVNLERALKLSDRLDGHLVSGHVDTKGLVNRIEELENYFLINIKTEKRFLKYVIDKGSVAIDGISLTVSHVFEDSFNVSIIPHTKAETNLASIKAGQEVNLEFDLVGKYIENFLSFQDKAQDISEDFLKKYGFY